jgi:hypothetical protein
MNLFFGEDVFWQLPDNNFQDSDSADVYVSINRVFHLHLFYQKP